MLSTLTVTRSITKFHSLSHFLISQGACTCTITDYFRRSRGAGSIDPVEIDAPLRLFRYHPRCSQVTHSLHSAPHTSDSIHNIYRLHSQDSTTDSSLTLVARVRLYNCLKPPKTVQFQINVILSKSYLLFLLINYQNPSQRAGNTSRPPR